MIEIFPNKIKPIIASMDLVDEKIVDVESDILLDRFLIYQGEGTRKYSELTHFKIKTYPRTLIEKWIYKIRLG